jgi:hypothetical protein
MSMTAANGVDDTPDTGLFFSFEYLNEEAS